MPEQRDCWTIWKSLMFVHSSKRSTGFSIPAMELFSRRFATARRWTTKSKESSRKSSRKRKKSLKRAARRSMPSLLDIRRRIRSVKNTQQLTKAMKTVSAAKLRRAQERVFSARPYAEQLKKVLGNMTTRLENIEHPLLTVRPEERILFLVVTADRGLCGAFNSNILRTASTFLREHVD